LKLHKFFTILNKKTKFSRKETKIDIFPAENITGKTLGMHEPLLDQRPGEILEAAPLRNEHKHNFRFFLRSFTSFGFFFGGIF